jgi:hypothetical protein
MTNRPPRQTALADATRRLARADLKKELAENGETITDQELEVRVGKLIHQKPELILEARAILKWIEKLSRKPANDGAAPHNRGEDDNG